MRGGWVITLYQQKHRCHLHNNVKLNLEFSLKQSSNAVESQAIFRVMKDVYALIYFRKQLLDFKVVSLIIIHYCKIYSTLKKIIFKSKD